MQEKSNLFKICGNDLIKYDSENDWSGIYFSDFPNATILKQYAGIYVFTLCGEVVYVGSSVNLFNRLRTHVISIQHGDNCKSLSVAERKYYYLNKYISKVEFQVLATYEKHISKGELEKYEYEYINLYNPIFNVNHGTYVTRWFVTDQDIDNFVNGCVTLNELRNYKRGS